MIRSRALVAGALMTLAPIAGLTVPAQAGEDRRFAIVEDIDFDADRFAFTALPPLCPAGTFTDDVTFIDSTDTYVKLDITSVYSCADGSGSFNARKRIKITFVAETTSFATGTVKLGRGTGKYRGLEGVGVNSGTTIGADGQAATTGKLTGHPR